MPSKEEFERLKETVAGLQVSLTATIEAVRALQHQQQQEIEIRDLRSGLERTSANIRSEFRSRLEDLEKTVQQAELERAAGEILAQADEGPEPD